jgi:hypothetical protein
MITIGLAKFQYIVALVLAVLALVAPRFLNVIVAVWLIIVAVMGLGLVR